MKDVRKRSLEVCCINIVTHPHTKQSYIDLLKLSTELSSIQIGEHEFVRIRHFKNTEYGDDAYRGVILKHLKITEDDNWLDDRTDSKADPSIVNNIIPEHLLPGLIEFEFVFYANNHRLFYTTKNIDGKSLSPNRAKNILELILNSAIKENNIDCKLYIHVETSKFGVEELFNLDVVQSIEYQITTPNPDDMTSLQAKLKQRLENQKIRQQTTKLTAEKGQSIEPDDITKSEVIVASSNGYAKTTGESYEGLVETKSTLDYPLIDKSKYSPKDFTLFQAMVKRSSVLLDEIINRLQ